MSAPYAESAASHSTVDAPYYDAHEEEIHPNMYERVMHFFGMSSSGAEEPKAEAAPAATASVPETKVTVPNMPTSNAAPVVNEVPSASGPATQGLAPPIANAAPSAVVSLGPESTHKPGHITDHAAPTNQFPVNNWGHHNTVVPSNEVAPEDSKAARVPPSILSHAHSSEHAPVGAQAHASPKAGTPHHLSFSLGADSHEHRHGHRFGYHPGHDHEHEPHIYRAHSTGQLHRRPSVGSNFVVYTSELEENPMETEARRGSMMLPSMAGLEFVDDKHDPEKGAKHEMEREAVQGEDTAAHEAEGQKGAPEAGAEQAAAPTKAEPEVNEEGYIIVKWDGDDREHPRSMPLWYRLYLTLLVSIMTLCTSFTSSAPSAVSLDVMKEFYSHDTRLIEPHFDTVKSSVFLYVGGFCFAPMFWAPLSEMFGRKIIFVISFVGFVCFNVGCMLAKNIGSLIIFRILAGSFSSSTLSNAPAMILSMFSLKQLMPGVVAFALGPMAGPALGPVVGSFIFQTHSSWRWVYRVSTIFSFVMLLLCLTMPETYEPNCLKKKAKRLRKETGDDRYRAPIELRNVNIPVLLNDILLKPFRMLFQEPMLVAVTVYISFVYGVLYLLFVAYPIVFVKEHNMMPSRAGLTFLGFFTGCVIAGLYCVLVDNTMYNKDTERHGGKHLPPEKRLRVSLVGAPILFISLTWFAWTSYSWISIWSPLVAGGLFGTAMFFLFLSLLVYITEVYMLNAASAMAVNTVVRSLFGVGFPMFGDKMYANVGTQWASMILAFIALGMLPIPFVLIKFGPKLRGMSKHAFG